MTYDASNCRDSAVRRNHAALLRLVAVLFLMAGLDEGGADTVPRRVWRKALRLLRPAESAVRRLIVVAARGIAVEAPKPRAERAPTSTERLQAKGLLVIHEGINLGLARAWRPEPAAEPAKPEPGLPVFPLTDPPRRFDKRGWKGLRPFPADGFVYADGNEEVSARNLCRRVQALKRALDDMNGHARRLARREARRAAGQLRAIHVRPVRLGHPPGHRRRPDREVDDILRECHALALQAPDTS